MALTGRSGARCSPRPWRKAKEAIALASSMGMCMGTHSMGRADLALAMSSLVQQHAPCSEQFRAQGGGLFACFQYGRKDSSIWCEVNGGSSQDMACDVCNFLGL